MITGTTEFKNWLLDYMGETLYDCGEEGNYTPEEAVEYAMNMEWCECCPRLHGRFLEDMPIEFMYDLNGTEIWNNDCPGFSQESKDFTIKVLTENGYRVCREYIDERINNGGCAECWTHTILFTLARFIDGDTFWRLKWEEHLKKMK